MEDRYREEEIKAAPEPRDNMQALQHRVDEVKDLMTQNLDRILARGERLDDLRTRSEYLPVGTQRFKRTARRVACSRWCNNMKMVVVVVVIVAIIILIIVLLVTKVIPIHPVTPTKQPLIHTTSQKHRNDQKMFP